MVPNFKSLRMSEPGLIAPADWNRLVESLEACWISGFEGGEVIHAGGTTRLRVRPPGAALGVTRALFPSLAGTAISVTPGLINSGAAAVTMGGTALDADPAPTLTIGGLPYFLMLRAEWVPGVEGESPQYAPDGIASIVSFTIVGASTTMTAPTTPTVDATSGSVTQNGIDFFLIAKWIDDGAGNPELATRRWGHRYFRVCHVDEAAWLKEQDY